MIPAHSDSPCVSVLMPVYNAEAYLRDAVESVLAQNFTDFEFLIHDDGSTDGSAEILRTFAAIDPRIHLSKSLNLGVAIVLNQLIHRARGRYLARMDADDVCVSNRLELQVSYLDRVEDVDVLGGDCVVIDASSRPIYYIRPPQRHAELDDRHLRGHCAIVHPTVMLRRDAVTAVGGYDQSIRSAEDLDLWLRLAERGKLANLSEVLLKYRIHGESASSTKRNLQIREVEKICNAACMRRSISVPLERKDWRIQDNLSSKKKFYVRYAWQAWNYGFRSTWRHYALLSIFIAPFSLEAWKVLIVGAFKRSVSK